MLGNPVRLVDPDGRVAETAWDVANIGIGVASLVDNVRQGNWGAAAVDGVGILADAGATLLPVVPGGAGSAIRVYRAADKVGEGAGMVAAGARGVSGGARTVNDLLNSASQADRGGFTRAGRSLTKHGQGARDGNRLFPQARGNPAQINRQAQAIVEEILGNPDTTVLKNRRGRFGDTVEYVAPDGRGLVYDAEGNFLFFREE